MFLIYLFLFFPLIFSFLAGERCYIFVNFFYFGPRTHKYKHIVHTQTLVNLYAYMHVLATKFCLVFWERKIASTFREHHITLHISFQSFGKLSWWNFSFIAVTSFRFEHSFVSFTLVILISSINMVLMWYYVDQSYVRNSKTQCFYQSKLDALY